MAAETGEPTLPASAHRLLALLGFAALVGIAVAHVVRASSAAPFVFLACFAVAYIAVWFSGFTRSAVALQLVIAWCAAPSMTHSEGALLALASAQLARVLMPRWILLYVFVQTLLLQAYLDASHGALDAWKASLELAGFAIFANALLLLLQRVEADRLEIARINTELMNARAELANRARADERQRMERNVHDGIGHLAAGARVQIETLRRDATFAADSRFATLLGTLESMLENARNFASNRQKRTLEEARADVAAVFPSVAVDVGMEGADSDTRALVAEHLRELVSNAVRHAQATEMTIHAVADHMSTRIEVSDNGAATHPGSDLGFGLQALRADVERRSGTLRVHPQPFRIEIAIPKARVQR